MKKLLTIIFSFLLLSTSYAGMDIDELDIDELDGQTPSADSMEGVDWGTMTDGKTCTYDATNTEVDCNTTAGGAFTATNTKIAPTATVTLDDATGNEIGYNFTYTTNKATSGNDYGLVVNMTDTASPGTSYLIDVQVAGVTKFNVTNAGVLTTTSISTGGAISTNSHYPATTASVVYMTGAYTSLNAAKTKLTLLGNPAGYAMTNTTGQSYGVTMVPAYNQVSGDGANTDVLINRTETAVGSGEQNLIDLQVGADSMFRVTNKGAVVYESQAITCSSNVCTDIAGAYAVYITTESDSTPDVLAIADGVAGQEKLIILKGAGTDDLTITPTNYGSGTSITCTTTGFSAKLHFDGTNWQVMSLFGCTDD